MQVAEEHHDYYIIELSSFQLDNMYNFRANIAVLMNITPDHLDRYDHCMQNYIDAKFRITQNQTTDDAFIFWNDDMPTEEIFTAPLRDGVNGKIVATKPLVDSGNIIDGFHMILKDGVITEVHAKVGEEFLKKAITLDDVCDSVLWGRSTSVFFSA